MSLIDIEFSSYDAIKDNAFSSVIFIQYAKDLMKKLVPKYEDLIKIDIKDLDNKIKKKLMEIILRNMKRIY